MATLYLLKKLKKSRPSSWGKEGVPQTAYGFDGGVFGAGFGKLSGGVSLFFQAVYVRLATDDLDDIVDNTPAGCIYEDTPVIDHATDEHATASAPQIERSLKIGGLRIMIRGWIYV